MHESNACWVGYVVGLIGKAPPMSKISQKAPSKISYGLKYIIGWLTARHSVIFAPISVLRTSNMIIHYSALLI